MHKVLLCFVLFWWIPIIYLAKFHTVVAPELEQSCGCPSASNHASTKHTKARPGPRFNIKMTSYQYRKSHCGDKTILRPSYLHSGISYTGKMTTVYRIRALCILPEICCTYWLCLQYFRRYTLWITQIYFTSGIRDSRIKFCEFLNYH